jgi:hypothetical protein
MLEERGGVDGGELTMECAWESTYWQQVHWFRAARGSQAYGDDLHLVWIHGLDGMVDREAIAPVSEICAEGFAEMDSRSAV